MFPPHLKWVGVYLLGMAGWFSPMPACSGLLIGPLNLEISARTRVAVVGVTNISDYPMELQTETLAWTQTDNADENAPTDEIVISPAIATVPPGKRQLFRVAVRRPLPPGSERAYRIIISDESEPPSDPEGNAIVQFRVAHSLPMFVQTQKTSKAVLEVTSCITVDQHVCVRVRNIGSRHAVLRRIGFSSGNWSSELEPNDVVLAGAEHTYTVQTTLGPEARIEVKVEANGSTTTGNIVVSP